jgi:hypothetical protein
VVVEYLLFNFEKIPSRVILLTLLNVSISHGILCPQLVLRTRLCGEARRCFLLLSLRFMNHDCSRNYGNIER